MGTATKTAADYFSQGVIDARQGKPMLARAASWQGKAYCAGYKEESDRITADRLKEATKPANRKPIFSPDPLPTFFLGANDMSYWPEGAREHAIQLRQALGKEQTQKRAQRLVRSLERMVARHSITPLSTARRAAA
jgi:hypothetical protein